MEKPSAVHTNALYTEKLNTLTYRTKLSSIRLIFGIFKSSVHQPVCCLSCQLEPTTLDNAKDGAFPWDVVGRRVFLQGGLK